MWSLLFKLCNYSLMSMCTRHLAWPLALLPTLAKIKFNADARSSPSSLASLFYWVSNESITPKFAARIASCLHSTLWAAHLALSLVLHLLSCSSRCWADSDWRWALSRSHLLWSVSSRYFALIHGDTCTCTKDTSVNLQVAELEQDILYGMTDIGRGVTKDWYTIYLICAVHSCLCGAHSGSPQL